MNSHTYRCKIFDIFSKPFFHIGPEFLYRVQGARVCRQKPLFNPVVEDFFHLQCVVHCSVVHVDHCLFSLDLLLQIFAEFQKGFRVVGAS